MSQEPLHPEPSVLADAEIAPGEQLPTSAAISEQDSRIGHSSAQKPGFANRVTAIFATRLVTLSLGLITTLLVARWLGPNNRGAWTAVATLPGMVSALGLLGFPNAVNYFAGRGIAIPSLVRASVIFTLIVSPLLVVGFLIALPTLEQSLLRGAPDDMARVMLLTLPLGMLATFGGTILYGRQEVRVYNLILVLQTAITLLGSVVLIGALGFGVAGAVATSVVVNVVVTVGVMAEVARLTRRDKAGQKTTLRALGGYAAKVYPASITGYFNYRADTYIIQAVSTSKNAADHSLGLYGIAVTMAEIVFYVPESVSSMFLPRVAAGSHEDSNAMIGRVSRLTMLASVVLALLLIPAAFIGIHLVLPKYNDCLPAFVAILPGVISLSLSKVMTSYVAGRGRPGPISVAAAITLVVNVGFNIILIPQFGIVGASLSSVASYSVMAAMMVVLASRMSGQSIACLCIPRAADFRVLATGSMALARHLARRRAAGTRAAG